MSEDYYRADESDKFMPVKVSRDTGVTIANPVTFSITPLTVEQALDMNLVDSSSVPDRGIISPNNAGKRLSLK